MEAGRSAILVDGDRNATWWTFAGTVFNAAIADALGGEADKVSFDNLAVSFSKVVDVPRLKERIVDLLKDHLDEPLQVPLDANFIQELKFSECLPQRVIDAEMISRYTCHQQLQALAGRQVFTLKQ